MTDLFNSKIWVVSPYYNPEKYTRRLLNYNIFRENINLPLLTIELERNGEFQLAQNDAEILLQLTGEDRIWQKERLINIGINALPEHVEYVAWIDCDVIFENENWPHEVMSALDNQTGFLQLFDKAFHLSNKDSLNCSGRGDLGNKSPILEERSVGAAIAQNKFVFGGNQVVRTNEGGAIYDKNKDDRQLADIWGMAWAAKREYVEQFGLYDANVVGGADAIKIMSVLDQLEDFFDTRCFSDAHRQHIYDWRDQIPDNGRNSRIGAISGNVWHLWHGDFSNRKYKERYSLLEHYDPKRDLQIAENGTWCWNDPDGKLAKDVAAYFTARREDG